MAAKVGQIYKTGDLVEQSGIYTVVHEGNHTPSHDVTCLNGRPFPRCSECAKAVFTLKYKARAIGRSEFFKASDAGSRPASAKALKPIKAIKAPSAATPTPARPTIASKLRRGIRG